MANSRRWTGRAVLYVGLAVIAGSALYLWLTGRGAVHVGIQGTGPLHVDLAAAVVNQGVTGLFLGYLWFRYRLMWPLLVTHGLINSGIILLGFF